MGNGAAATRDMIHLVLQRMGYVGGEFVVIRTLRVLYATYRKDGGSVVVTCANGSSVYQLSTTPAEAVDAVRDELARVELICTPAGTGIVVYGQEHIDREVERMLQL